MINIYCDESCHLENDNQKVMVIGGVMCPDYKRKIIYEDIRKIKIKHNIHPHIEIKWNKVSISKIEYYMELVEYFFENDLLNFRAVVIPDKSVLKHEEFHQTHDDFYYKLYFNLIKKIYRYKEKISVYLDIKDTTSSEKIKKLKRILNSNYNYVENIQHIRSHENSILQLTDLLIGAISYKNRNLVNNDAKIKIISLIEKLSNQQLNKKSSYLEQKFDIFIMDLNRG